MNYDEAMAFIKEKQTLGSVYGLEGIRRLLDRLDNPQKELSCIHIAGTNGKGSTLAFVSAVLTKSGYKTGSYVSPSVFGYEEKIQIDGKWILKEDVARLLTLIHGVCESMAAEGLPHPTVFEMETAMAFLYFKEKKCRFVCLECGLGGRLDATNIIEKPICTAFSSISRDHMGLLGESLGEIGKEKAGILKKGCPAVSTVQEPEVEKALREMAEKVGCPLQFTEPAFFLGAEGPFDASGEKCKKKQDCFQRFSYKEYENLEISLLGQHQLQNAALALEILNIVSSRGFFIPKEKVYLGMKEACWPGRFSKMGDEPLFFLDGAHNEQAAKELAETIKFYFTNRKICYIMGVFRDKEYEKILAETAPLAGAVITITAPGERGLPGRTLAEKAGSWCKDTSYAGTYEEAVLLAREKAGRDGVVIAFGSLSFLGELAQLL